MPTAAVTRVYIAVCLYVFPYNISKTDAARITKLHTELFHHESWKPIYSGDNRSKAKVMSLVTAVSMKNLLIELAVGTLTQRMTE